MKKKTIVIVGGLILFAIYLMGPHSSSDLMRVELIKAGLKGWRAHPWFGYGPGQYMAAYLEHRTAYTMALVGNPRIVQASAHCLPVEVLCCGGLFGFTAFLGALWLIWRGSSDIWARGFYLGMGFISLFSPLHPVSYAALAVVIGHELTKEKEGRILKGRILPGILVVIAGLLLATQIPQIMASRHGRLAQRWMDEGHQPRKAALHWLAAARWWPFEPVYADRAAAVVQSFDGMTDLEDKTMEAAFKSVKLHPKSVVALRGMMTAARKKPARLEIKKALDRLDPRGDAW